MYYHGSGWVLGTPGKYAYNVYVYIRQLSSIVKNQLMMWSVGMFLNIFYSCFAELEQTFNVDLVHDLGAVIVSVE